MNSSAPSTYALRMSIFFGSFFFPFGIYIPFAGVWLKSLGFNAAEIGIVLMIPLIARVIFTPFMAAVADRIGDRRLTLRIYCTAFALTFALITLDDSLGWIMLIMGISHIAQSAIVPIADSLAMAGSRRYDLDYGRMRSVGSLTFVIANLAGGAFLDMFGANKIIWLMVVGNLLQIATTFALPKDPRLIDNQTMTKGTKLDWSQLSQFAQSGFWVILLALCLVQASHALLYAFGTIYWEELGIAPGMTGIFWSVSVCAEVVIFAFSKRISSLLNWKKLLIVSCILASIRWALFPLELSETGYLLLQLLHAASFGFSHLATMFFIANYVDDALSGTAQGLYTMLTGLLLAITTYFSGLIYADMGGSAFFIMTAISLMALLLLSFSHLFPLNHIERKESQQQ